MGAGVKSWGRGIEGEGNGRVNVPINTMHVNAFTATRNRTFSTCSYMQLRASLHAFKRIFLDTFQ